MAKSPRKAEIQNRYNKAPLWYLLLHIPVWLVSIPVVTFTFYQGFFGDEEVEPLEYAILGFGALLLTILSKYSMVALFHRIQIRQLGSGGNPRQRDQQ